MGLDIICLIFYALGIYKGLRKGLLAAILNLLGYFIALALAVSFSNQLTKLLVQLSGISGFWVPIVSFMLIFIGVILIVQRLIALLNKGVEFVMLGWLNKLGGVLFYMALYTLILMIFFYCFSFIPFILNGYLNHSICYKLLHDKMPVIIHFIENLFPS